MSIVILGVSEVKWTGVRVNSDEDCEFIFVYRGEESCGSDNGIRSGQMCDGILGYLRQSNAGEVGNKTTEHKYNLSVCTHW